MLAIPFKIPALFWLQGPAKCTQGSCIHNLELNKLFESLSSLLNTVQKKLRKLKIENYRLSVVLYIRDHYFQLLQFSADIASHFVLIMQISMHVLAMCP